MSRLVWSLAVVGVVSCPLAASAHGLLWQPRFTASYYPVYVSRVVYFAPVPVVVPVDCPPLVPTYAPPTVAPPSLILPSTVEPPLPKIPEVTESHFSPGKEKSTLVTAK